MKNIKSIIIFAFVSKSNFKTNYDRIDSLNIDELETNMQMYQIRSSGYYIVIHTHRNRA